MLRKKFLTSWTTFRKWRSSVATVVAAGESLKVAVFSEFVQSDILKTLIQKVSALKEVF